MECVLISPWVRVMAQHRVRLIGAAIQAGILSEDEGCATCAAQTSSEGSRAAQSRSFHEIATISPQPPDNMRTLRTARSDLRELRAGF